MKHIFVTGGVVSGLGKGICAASLARLLKQRGYKVQNQIFSPASSILNSNRDQIDHIHYSQG